MLRSQAIQSFRVHKSVLFSRAQLKNRIELGSKPVSIWSRFRHKPTTAMFTARHVTGGVEQLWDLRNRRSLELSFETHQDNTGHLFCTYFFCYNQYVKTFFIFMFS